MATEGGTREEMPRRKGNKPAISPEVHFHQTITIPLLDELDGQMTRRFSRLQQIASKGMYLIPSVFLDGIPTAKAACWDYARQHEADIADLSDLDVTIYGRAGPDSLGGTRPRPVTHSPCPSAEVNKWDVPFPRRPEHAAVAVHMASQHMRMWAVCQSSQTPKTYLRSTTSQDRLSSLALLHVHYATQLDHEEVIRVFRCKKNRRVNL